MAGKEGSAWDVDGWGQKKTHCAHIILLLATLDFCLTYSHGKVDRASLLLKIKPVIAGNGCEDFKTDVRRRQWECFFESPEGVAAYFQGEAGWCLEERWGREALKRSLFYAETHLVLF